MKTSASNQQLESSRAIAEASLSRAVSFPAVKPLQMKVTAAHGSSTVEWETEKIAGDDVGIYMSAKALEASAIGKHENLVGSPPAPNQQVKLMSLLPTDPKLKTEQKYIKGHLLNHNIGGPGKAFNMFPITASANKGHLMAIETDVKKWVKGGAKVDYAVKVNYDASGLDPLKPKANAINATFDCLATNKDTGESINKSVPSIFGAKTVPDDFFDALKFQGAGVFAFTAKAITMAEDPQSQLWDIAARTDHILKTGNWIIIRDIITAVVDDGTLDDLSEEAIQAFHKIAGELLKDRDWAKDLYQ